MVGACQRDTEDNWKSSHWPVLEQSEQQPKGVLDYNPKCKTNSHESMSPY